MPRFDADNAVVVQGLDRKKLRVGRYLIRQADAREVVGAYKGDRFQLDFEIVKGKFAAPGTVKGDIVMLRNIEAANGQAEKEKIKKDNGKIQKMLSAFTGEKPQAINNARFAQLCREQKVRSNAQQTEIISESMPAEKLGGYGKLAVLVVQPYVKKTGPNAGKKSCFYEYEPFKGDDSIFEEYDPSQDAYEDEGTDTEDDSPYAAANDEILRNAKAAQDSASDEPPPPDEEEEPLTKAAKDGWKFNTKSKPGSKWYFKGKEQLKEADLVAKYS